MAMMVEHLTVRQRRCLGNPWGGPNRRPYFFPFGLGITLPFSLKSTPAVATHLAGVAEGNYCAVRRWLGRGCEVFGLGITLPFLPFTPSASLQATSRW